MAEPVEWRADGTPFSPRFQDRYRSEDGGLAQAREVFVAGCGLPQAWRGAARWCVLETGFGLGLNFLATWKAWRDDPDRPATLHYVATEAWPADADDVRRNAQVDPGFDDLGRQLADAWWGLDAGTHRLSLDGGRVLLTLLVGDSAEALRGLGRWADSVYLDGFSPDRNPDMWRAETLRAVARCCRPGARLSTWTVARTVRDGLTAAGFSVRKVEGVPPKRHNLQAELVHLPARHVALPDRAPGRCVVAGAGLAGAAAARSLALRGWRATVFDPANSPASGASGVPAGLFAPHVSADDAVLSRLSRAGVRSLCATADELLERSVDWDISGVTQIREGQLPVFHRQAGWMRPAALVRAMLATPGVTVRYGEALDLAAIEAETLVIIATGHASGLQLGYGLTLQPVAGQVSYGPTDDAPAVDGPWNGHGHFLPRVPDHSGANFWLTGASFERDSAAVVVPDGELETHRAGNRQRLAELLPLLEPALPTMFTAASDWRGVRGTSPDRLPIVGPWPDDTSRVWACTALGARGITMAVLCAEILAARLHGEPMPVDAGLVKAVGTKRIVRRIARKTGNA
ncbi:tRNA (5-methylaminomethyl-2-thiouridine)(34)-methyltransferase MnmD [Xylophilus sp. GOD-11R]|uniref:tRNA (5-methylaminomethyl-2-thiouridine)(34)-methyltransferase MnmD n=1 Tax=Xylophilus sp. GOD-11R TaxID=3089814 RepID=UPI00298D105F|nr:tRNA (5-methylaminomethyl-2-thiouridine)(34)-methyltransferase MnmD [Xylophilus sp. GOD-11R]WPB59140.1 tRNA (5-methylaminomethyl-2-thiouridine)(34)-methyltransferase MnmD [Xylophilus sp. GOD-11R]